MTRATGGAPFAANIASGAIVERSNLAFAEMAERQGATTYGTLAVARKEGAEEIPAESEGRWRIWVKRPDSIREEFEGAMGSAHDGQGRQALVELQRALGRAHQRRL